MRKWRPLLLLAALAFAVYLLYCVVTNKKPVQGLIGYSRWSTNPMPSSPAPSSNYMGVGSPLR